MEEQLKIKIIVDSNDAKRKLQKVKEELTDVGKTSKESGKKITETGKKIKDVGTVVKESTKQIKTAITAISAFTAGFIALGKSSQEFQKEYGRLTTSFQSVGASAKLATKTYKDLYGFMGDTQAATEAASLLAQLTTNEKDLATWTNILKGAYAKFNNAITVESLAESANETAKTAIVTGQLADALNWVGVSEDAVNAKLATLNSNQEREAYLRELLNSLYSGSAQLYDKNNKSLIEYNQATANMQIALAKATSYITPLLTAFANLATIMLTVLKPALDIIASGFIILSEIIGSVFSFIGSLFGLFSSGKGAVDDVASSIGGINSGISNLGSGASGLSDSLGDAAKNAKELKKHTQGFDELNIIPKETGSSAATGGGSVGGGGGISIPTIDTSGFELPKLDSFISNLDEVKEKVEGVLALVLSFAAPLAAYKAYKWFKGIGSVSTILRMMGEALLIIAGAILLVAGYSDAWANGINWKNLLMIISGIGMVVGGIALSFGTLYAALALVGGGIALVVLGVKDFINNGYSWEAIIAIAVGAIAILIGAIWAFNSALLANPITWVIVGIIALVAAFVILWNECEGFRNFWKVIWAAIVTMFTMAVEKMKQVIDFLVEAFKWAWDAIKVAWSVAGAFFNAIWNTIKGVFAVVKAVLSGNWKDAWEAIKNIVNSWKEYFKAKWDGIKKVFEPIVEWFKNIFSKAWSGIKSVFSGFGSFFSGLWNTIKNTFSNLGTNISNAIGGAVKAGINGVISIIENTINGAIGLINGAIDLVNKIPGVEIGYINDLNLPRLAKGGIVTSSTIANIGEAGKEAVLPLENNTEWMNILADKIASRNSAPSKVILSVDGKELGWASINGINSITKQTGNLQLKLV